MEQRKNPAEAVLPAVLPGLIALLNEAPSFGLCGIEIHFHEGKIARIVSRIERSYKADSGGAKK